MSNQSFKYDYDNKNDVLYFSVGIPRPSYGEALFDDNGIIARYDMLTDELNGITIIDFKNRLENKDPKLNQIPIEFDFLTLSTCVNVSM
jgi:hypothetical protein